jgi:hypothetical protein
MGCLSGDSPEVVPALRFLGLKISSDGNISRWKEDYTQATWALWTRLQNTGLGCYPRALIKAY